MALTADEYFKGIDEIKDKLDVLLLAIGQINRNDVITLSGSSGCSCSKHKTGESTSGWFCPVHGQMF